MKILHVLDHYKPHFSGYVFRTSYILKYQKELGLDPVVVTSPKQGNVKESIEEIDSITVYRTAQNGFGDIPFIREIKLMNTLQKKIEEVIKLENPDIIHAHSPSLNGIPALRAGRKYGIPVAYEIRAFWEDAAVDHRTFKESSFKYRVSRFIETGLLKRADALFTICSGLRDDIVSRNIPEQKVAVIPNCVDTDFFSPLEPEKDLIARHGLSDKVVFGFIGSFYQYEGLDLLIGSFPSVLKTIKNARLLLVGDGPDNENISQRVKANGLEDKVIFTGKVPHAEIKNYYSVMDFLVYPRKSMRLTELVTPLKPLEAMAMGKIIAGSDVGGIKELITHGRDGFLFKAGDVEGLSRLLVELSMNKENLKAFSLAAIETVQKRHNWESAVKGYLPVYERLINRE